MRCALCPECRLARRKAAIPWATGPSFAASTVKGALLSTGFAILLRNRAKCSRLNRYRSFVDRIRHWADAAAQADRLTSFPNFRWRKHSLLAQSAWGTPITSAPLPIRSEEHTSELQSLMRTSYAVFCLKNHTKTNKYTHPRNETQNTTN